MIPREEWPLVLNQAQIQECLGVPRSIANELLNSAMPDKTRKSYRFVTKRDLLNYLEGGHEKKTNYDDRNAWQRRY